MTDSRKTDKNYIVSVLAILFWAAQMTLSQAWYFSYLLLVLLSLYSLKQIHENPKLYHLRRSDKPGKPDKIHWLVYTASAGFSCMLAGANYTIFLPVEDRFSGAARVIYIILMVIATLVSGYIVFCQIFRFLWIRLKDAFWKEEENIYPAWKVFGFVFLIFTVTALFLFFAGSYPGNSCYDSISQIYQSLTGYYSNHHPYWNTILISFFVHRGLDMTGDINVGVAMFSCFQIVVMSLIYAAAVMTVYEMKVRPVYVLGLMLFYLLVPCNIIFMFTLYKDVLFGGFVLLFLVFLFRILADIGKNIYLNYFFLVFSGVEVCLQRSNGFIAFALFLVIFIILFFKSRKVLAAALCCSFALGWFFKYPVLENIGVSQTDTVESLSIPVQQIARVIVNDGNISDQETMWLGQIMDFDQVKEDYVPYISDNIKIIIRHSGNKDLLDTERSTFYKIYISLGLKNIGSYLAAWVDETMGFWNAGYDTEDVYFYWQWYEGVMENDYGVENTVFMPVVENIYKFFLNLFKSVPFLQLFISTGVYTWIILFLMLISIVRKNPGSFVLSFLLFAVVLTLLIASPVYAELRYAYSSYLGVPFVLFASFHRYPTGRISRPC